LALESDDGSHQGSHSEVDSGLIDRCAHFKIPPDFVVAGGGPEPAMLRTAPAIAFLIRRLEDRCRCRIIA
jgi:hypothetical protein